MKKNCIKVLKVSFLIIATAIILAILSACNSTPLENEHFEGNCIKKGFTRYYMPNGSYVDREDKDFGAHSYDEGTLISERTCTQDEVTKFVCTVCKDEKFESVAKFGHDYKVIATLDPTCTDDGKKDFECSRCKDAYSEKLQKLGHDYAETVTKQPTCTEAGSKDLRCKRCGDEDTATIDMLSHTPKGDVEHDETSHWFICANCNEVCGEPHKFTVKNCPSTCIEYAYDRHACTVCEYFYDVEDRTVPFKAHSYEAYTCNHCQRDNLLDYKSEFDSRGSDSDNLINIRNENMFICFYDYLLAYQVTEKKYVELTYKTLYSGNSISNYITEIRRKGTATNWNVDVSSSSANFSGEVLYLIMNASDSGNFQYSQVATYTPSSYDEKTCKQYNSYQFERESNKRENTFDDFMYKTRRNSMTVSSSDQLFYAFEHGYLPDPVVNSPADSMLKKAKSVARRIMDDSMDDVAKLRAIFSYLVREIDYDYGIVELTSNKSVNFAKCSSYYLEGVFNYSIAVCDGISKALCVLAGIEDIKCVRVTSVNHAWNKVFIDPDGDGTKSWYGMDATWGNQAVSNEGGLSGEYLSVEDFLFTDAHKTNRGQQGLNYVTTNSNATDDENPFKHFYFGNAQSESTDYVIASDSELTALVNHLKNNYGAYPKNNSVTLQMFIVSSYLKKEDAAKTINHKLNAVMISMSLNMGYVIDDRDLTYGGVTGYTVAIIFSK